MNHGKHLTVVMISSAEGIDKWERPMANMIGDMEEINAEVLPEWSGDLGGIQGLNDCVNRLVNGEYEGIR